MYAGAELLGAEADGKTLELTFYAPVNATVLLRLESQPEKIELDENDTRRILGRRNSFAHGDALARRGSGLSSRSKDSSSLLAACRWKRRAAPKHRRSIQRFPS